MYVCKWQNLEDLKPLQANEIKMQMLVASYLA